VPARIGVHLRAIQGHGAKLERPQIACELEHLDKQRLELRQEAHAKGRDRVVIGMLVAGDETKRHRVVASSIERLENVFVVYPYTSSPSNIAG
jgi:hypothetical protein